MTTYYVDQTLGADGNAGTSPGAPWQTISKVNGYSFTAGDRILFKAGEVWREQLVVPSNGASGQLIEFGKYGSGDDPKWLGSVEKNDTSDWTAEGGGEANPDEWSDDFNDNDLSGWDNVVGGVVNQNQRLEVSVDTSVDSQDYIAETNDITTRTEYYMSWRRYYNSFDTFAAGKYMQGGGFNGRLHVGVVNDAGTLKWRIHYWTDAGGAGTAVTTAKTLTTGQLYNILIYWRQDTDAGADIGGDDGIARVYIDNELIWEKTDMDTDTLTVSSVKLGNNYSPADVVATFHEDNLKVGTSEAGGLLWYASNGTQVRQCVLDNESEYTTRVLNKGDLSEQGEVWWDSTNSRLYMYSEYNPAAYYNGSIELCQLVNIVNTNSKDYLKFSNIDCRYTSRSAFYLGTASDTVILNACTMKFTGETYSAHASGEWSGAGVYGYNGDNFTIQNCTISYVWFGIYFQRTASDTATHLIDGNNISYCIMGGNTPSECHGIAFGGTAVMPDYDGTIVSNNTITNFGNRGVGLSHSKNVTVEANVIHTIWEGSVISDTAGIYMGTTDSTGHIVRYNHVYNISAPLGEGYWNAGLGIGTREARSSEIYYNIIHDCTKGIYVGQKTAGGNNDNNEIYNNVCYNCSRYGIWINDGISGNVLNVTIKNNICDGGVADIRLEDYVLCTGGYNCLINDAAVSKSAVGTTYNGSADDLYATDPKFADPANRDFTLRSDSPCIDAGANVGLSRDYAGNAVPQGSGVDIGAYEYVVVEVALPISVPESRIEEYQRLDDWEKLVVFEHEFARKLQDETWTQGGSGVTDAWHISLPNEGEIFKVEENGEEYDEVFSESACHAASSSFFYDDLNKTLYVHTSGSDDPATPLGGGTKYNLVAFWWEYVSNRPKQLEPYDDILKMANGGLEFRSEPMVIDESHGRLSSGDYWQLRNVTGRTLMAQSFELSDAGNLTHVKLALARNGTPSGNIWVEIHSSTVGTSAVKNASANIVGQATDSLSAGSLSTAYTWVQFDFSGTQPNLSAATTYYLVLYGDYAIGANCIRWTKDDGYDDGQTYFIDNLLAWEAQSGDQSFQIFGLKPWNFEHWTVTRAGSSDVEGDSDETYDNHSAYSAKFTGDGGNNTCQIHREDILLRPRRKARIKLKHIESASGKTIKIMLKDSGGNVYLNSSGEWQAASTYISIANSQVWAGFEIDFIAHEDYSLYCLYVKNDDLTSASAYVDNIEVWRYRREVDCKAWLPLGGLPVVNQSVGDYHMPDEQIQYGNVAINNVDGWYWSRRRPQGYLWHGKEARLWLGKITDTYETLIRFFTGLISRPRFGNTIELNVEDERVLLKKVPIDRFDDATYPYCEDEWKNRPIPILLGRVRDIKPPQINTLTKKFKVSQTTFNGVTYGIEAITEVYKTTSAGVKTLLTETTHYTTDLTNGEFTVLATLATGDVITCNALGLKIDFENWTYACLVGHFLYFLYVELNGVSKYRIDIASLLELNEYRVLECGVWLFDEVESIDELIRWKRSAVFQTVPRLDGLISFPVYKNAVLDDAPHYYAEDFIEHPKPEEDTDQCYKTVTGKAGYYPYGGYYRWEHGESANETEWDHNKKDVLDYETILCNEFQLRDLLENYLGMLKDPPEVLENFILPASALLLNPCDKFYLTYAPNDSNGNPVTVYDDEVFRALRLSKDLNTGKVTVTAIKDTANFAWTIGPE